MDDKSQIDYWHGEENILTVPTTKVPGIGDVIHINTEMDENWHDAHFPNRKLFREGVRSEYKVYSVRRYYKGYDYKLEDGDYIFPAQKIVETFEVVLIKI